MTTFVEEVTADANTISELEIEFAMYFKLAVDNLKKDGKHSALAVMFRIETEGTEANLSVLPLAGHLDGEALIVAAHSILNEACRKLPSEKQEHVRTAMAYLVTGGRTDG